MDSEFVVRQLNGDYGIKSENMKPLFHQVKTLEQRFNGGIKYYHHPRSSPEIVRMITGKAFEVSPPQPTAEEKRMAHEIVEHLIALHYKTFREACIEVLGEDPETD